VRLGSIQGETHSAMACRARRTAQHWGGHEQRRTWVAVEHRWQTSIERWWMNPSFAREGDVGKRRWQTTTECSECRLSEQAVRV
jgi:hypothetical protein